MKEHGNFISYLLLCIAVLLLGVSGVFTTISLNQMEQKLNNVEEQNEIILREYDLKQRQINDLKVVIDTYASETDAKLNILAGDVQELKLEKEVKDVELHQQEEVEEPSSDKSNMTPLGEYTLTAYEYTSNPCADGSTPTEWWSVACNDPALWHKKIYIEGYGDFYVCDTGGMPSYNILDIYLGDVSVCYDFGVRSATVWVYD